MLREPTIHDPSTDTYWSTSTLFSLVIDLLEHGGSEKDTRAIIEEYTAFVQKVVDLALPAAIEEKPRLDVSVALCNIVSVTMLMNPFSPQGHEINQLLSLKPSAFTRILTNLILVWQIENPTRTKDECKAWLLAEKEEGSIEFPSPSGGEKAKKGKHQELGEPKGEKKAKKGN